MQHFDLSFLNPIEFQELVLDLLEKQWGARIERFKTGKDSGIDGRFTLSNIDEQIIIQCKHYCNSGFSNLIQAVKKEAPKLSKFKPNDYYLVTSLPLSPQNKISIQEALLPYQLKPQNILSKDDILSLISQYSDITRKYYKLWIPSTDVLDLFLHKGIYTASKFDAEIIKKESKYYAVTSIHKQAYKKLEKEQIVIISGVAGVGKTTLAKELCLQSISEGFDFYTIRKNISEAYEVFDENKRQIFYFDDFLGSNFLSGIMNNEDSDIVRFIRMIKSSQGRLVLTSRSNILKQAKTLSEKLKSKDIDKPEYVIEINNLPEYDRCLIFYQLLRRTTIPNQCFEAFLNPQFFRGIVRHYSFNPRLLEMITSLNYVEHNISSNMSGEAYIKWIKQCMSNPKFLWSNPFISQIDDYGRLLVCLVTLCGNNSISEKSLMQNYEDFISKFSLNRVGNQSSDFFSVVEPLCDFFIKREISTTGDAFYSIFNPSVSDYVYEFLEKHKSLYQKLVFTLQTTQSLDHLCSYRSNNSELTKSVLTFTLDNLNSLSDCDVEFILKVAKHCKKTDFLSFYTSYLSTLVLRIQTRNLKLSSYSVNLLVDFLDRYCREFKSINTNDLFICIDYCLQSVNLTFDSLLSISNIIDTYFFENQDIYDSFKCALSMFWKFNIENYAYENLDNYVTEMEYGIETSEAQLLQDILDKNDELIINLEKEKIEDLIESLDLENMYKETIVENDFSPPKTVLDPFDHSLIWDLYNSRLKG